MNERKCSWALGPGPAAGLGWPGVAMPSWRPRGPARAQEPVGPSCAVAFTLQWVPGLDPPLAELASSTRNGERGQTPHMQRNHSGVPTNTPPAWYPPPDP